MCATAPKVVIAGSFRFPEGDAAAARVLGIGKALRDHGYEVIFAGGEPAGRGEDLQANGRFVYQSFSYHSTGELRTEHVSPVRRFLRFLRMGRWTLRWFETADMRNLAAVILYHGTCGFVNRLRSFCRERGAALIVDCTEWYDPGHLVGGRFGPVRWDNEMRLRVANPRVGRIVAISGYLEAYYRRKGCKVLRVPPLIDLQEQKWHRIPRGIVPPEPLRLVYAGSPGKKDFLGNILLGLRVLREQSHPVELHVIGPPRDAVAACLGRDADCLTMLEREAAVVCHGRIPQHEVPEELARSHFSVLLRPKAKYADAGFPTKLVESLGAGVPILTNATSDIGNYVRDGVEGVLLAGHSPRDFADGVTRVLAMPRDQWKDMRQRALLRAEECFDYRQYCQAIGAFVRDSVAEAKRIAHLPVGTQNSADM